MSSKAAPSRKLCWLYGGVAAALGAALASPFAAALDASYAASESVGALRLFSSLSGLIAPLCLAVGICIGAARGLLADGRGLSASRLRNELRSLDERERGAFAVSAVGVALAVLVWVVSTANLGARLLASDASPADTGAALALCSAGLGWLLFVVVRAGASALGPKLGRVRAERALLLSLLIAGLGLGVAIAAGSTSGTGGALAVLGVFKRPELDLRGVGLLLVLGLGAALMPAPRRPLSAVVAGLFAISPLVLTLYSATAGLSNRHIGLAIERGAPLGKKALSFARSLTDRDRDGASAHFGGGDCNDSDPRVGPEAVDVPGNGRDEDCSGADELFVAPKPATPDADAQAAGARATLPKNLGVVLISIDTLRWDLGYMGYGRPITPNLDALSRRSAVFEQAYALASYTAKSLGPMLIGKYAGETERGFSHFNRFPKSELFVQERLQQAGVFTLSVQGYWYFYENSGFERGFDVIDSSAAPKVKKVEGDNTFNSHEISDAAVALLAKPELADRPFFMWAHYVDPHSEYVHHREFDFGTSARDRYDSEVAFVDREVGRVLSAIEQGPLRERTAVIVTSDHGEAFGEHGMIRHGFELWEELVRVPLIVYVPGGSPRRVTVRRSTIDLVPTLLELLGGKPASGEGRDFLSGKSLLPDVFAPEGHTLEERPIYVDMAAGPYNAERQAYIEGNLKLVLSGVRPLSLFDLSADPGEKRDLLDQRDIADPILQRFKRFRASLRSVRVVPPP